MYKSKTRIVLETLFVLFGLTVWAIVQQHGVCS